MERKSTSRILTQMMIAKCLLKSFVKNLDRSLIPWTQTPLLRLMKMRTTRKAKRKKPSSSLCDNIECFASTAEILRPKKRIKVEDLSTVTIGYIENKHPDRLEENQRFRVLFDSGCSATMIHKKFVKHWKKQPVKTIKWSSKAGSLRPRRAVTLNSHSLASTSSGKLSARLM
jgi:hypothetical protein